MNEVQTITTNQCYLSEVDENGKPMIDPAYYQNVITDYIESYIDNNNLDRTKLNNNNMLSICLDINKAVFTNHKQAYSTDRRANIPYTEYNLNTLLRLYVDIVISYGCMPSLFAFSKLTGIDEGTVKKYLTPASIEIVNFRREMLRNLLADDKTGRIVLANNDASFGLEYEKKNITERETIRQGLAVGELPQF